MSKYIGFRLLRCDPLLKAYRLMINKRNDEYHVNFGAPSTQIKREYTVDLGLTTGGGKCVIGATFGRVKDEHCSDMSKMVFKTSFICCSSFERHK